jgi:hypothetical protein
MAAHALTIAGVTRPPPARDCDVEVAVANRAERFADRHCRGGAGDGVGENRAADPVLEERCAAVAFGMADTR